MKVVALDCRFASLPVGIGRYTREIIAELLKRDDPWTYVLFVRSEDETWIPTHERVKTVKAPFSHYSFAEQFLFPALIRRSKADLFFAPQFNVPLSCPVPFVATVHDLILHHFPNQASFLKRFAYRLLLRHAVIKSEQLLTVSQSTKNDLVRTFGPTMLEKIHVASPGVASLFRVPSEDEISRVRTTYRLPGRYFLYVGNAKEHKNVQLLIDAFDKADLDASLVLLLFGKEADSLKLSRDCIRLNDVPDSDLPAIYGASLGFASATKYEGFGLPFIEAMASGTPVLTSDIPVLRETCGNHALLVPPTVEAFTLGFRSLKRDQNTIEAARTYAEAFTWKKTAEEVASVLARSLGY